MLFESGSNCLGGVGFKLEKSMAHSDRLTKLIDVARNHKMTPHERRSQRVSLVMGLRGHSSTLTKEKVETILEDVEGLQA